jgi:hypothetical protein
MKMLVPALLGLCLAGCYSLQPAGGVVPEVGARVAFDVNDAGRVALGGSMGPEIAQVEGQLVEKDGGSYLLAVTTIRLLRGGEQVWSGEQVRLKSEYLGSAYERKVSVARSVGLGVVGIGGFALLLAKTSLLGGGTKDNPGGGDSAQTSLGRP